LRRSMSQSDSDIACPKCETKRPRRVFSMFATGAYGGGCAPSGHG